MNEEIDEEMYEEVDEDNEVKTQLDAIVKLLRSTATRTVKATYDGSGDEGVVEGVEFFDGNGKAASVPEEARDMVDELVEYILPEGWDVNEGSCGVVIIDVDSGILTRKHGWKETVVNYDSDKFEDGKWRQSTVEEELG